MLNSRQSPAIRSPSKRRAMNFSRSSMGSHTFQGILRSPQKAQLCYPCVRNEVSPFSQEGHGMSEISVLSVLTCTHALHIRLVLFVHVSPETAGWIVSSRLHACKIT